MRWEVSGGLGQRAAMFSDEANVGSELGETTASYQYPLKSEATGPTGL